MRPIVWVSEPLQPLCERLSPAATIVRSPDAFLAAERDMRTPSFVDRTTIEVLDRFAAELGGRTDQESGLQLRRLVSAVSIGPVVALCDPPLESAMSWLSPHPWLSHLLGTSIFQQIFASQHFANILGFCAAREPRLLDWLEPTEAGRRVRLTHANRCAERLERMGHFFESQGLEADVVARLCEIAEELLVNAFYEAPVAANASASTVIDRKRNVALPEDHPCDLAYGCRDGLAILRVRDPFGSLSRDRLVKALAVRPAQGLAKAFAAASIFAVSVVRSVRTEVLAAVPTTGVPTPVAFHFFSKEGPGLGKWYFTDDDTGSPVVNDSITLTFIEQP